ncbi:MAG: cytochrome c oxidase subunit 2 [Planctomycetota bacterium]|jgi:cytochrome c oxidase subunit 2
MNLPIFHTLASLVQDQKVAVPSDPTAEGTYWFPVQASTLAEKSDWTFYYIYWVSAFFTALIVAAMVFMAIRYRYRKGVWEGEKSAGHSWTLEITWSIIPFLLTIVMWWSGFQSYMYSDTVPPDAYTIQVRAQQWSWEFEYPNGAKTYKELHLPVDRDVTFVMSSKDVIHGFWIPAFRVKKDVVPGRYTKTWVHPTMEGQYTLFCTEYCGTNHSQMMVQVTVESQESFDQWVTDAAQPYGDNPIAVEVGQTVWSNQCVACHSIDGSVVIGPSWKGSWGTEREFEGGGSAIMDENYILNSMSAPNSQVVKGYPPVMPAYKELKQIEIDGIIAYIKSLGN